MPKPTSDAYDLRDLSTGTAGRDAIGILVIPNRYGWFESWYECLHGLGFWLICRRFARILTM